MDHPSIISAKLARSQSQQARRKVYEIEYRLLETEDESRIIRKEIASIEEDLNFSTGNSPSFIYGTGKRLSLAKLITPKEDFDNAIEIEIRTIKVGQQLRQKTLKLGQLKEEKRLAEELAVRLEEIAAKTLTEAAYFMMSS